jgi:alanine dehydrogenase
MKIGIIWSSNKANERRYPLNWKHIKNLSDQEADSIIFEENYPHLKKIDRLNRIQTMNRTDVFKNSDLIILPKPTPEDFSYFQDNQIIWGWPHCVQSPEITQIAIDKKMTLIAWEEMYVSQDGRRYENAFARNQIVAGYASTMHCLTTLGMTAGIFGEDKKAAVIGYGSTGKGAVSALLGLGCNDVTVFTKRSKFDLFDFDSNVKYRSYTIKNHAVSMNGHPSAEELKKYDIVVNCILQNPIKPIMFMNTMDAERVNKQMVIIDVSCDKGMGFEFAVPTSFDKPMFEINNVVYYAVDNSPSYLFESASYELSYTIIPYLKHIIANGTYKGNEVLENAVEIEKGVIKNKKIIDFQKRNRKYPHEFVI